MKNHKLIFLLSFITAFAFWACGEDSSNSTKSDDCDIKSCTSEEHNTAQKSGTIGSFIDNRDGREYKTIVIGTQTWMKENLNYAVIDSDGEEFYSRCFQGNEEYCAKYGRTYRWYSAIKACPTGWLLPDTTDWNSLIDFVGGKEVAGLMLKSDSGWNEFNGESGNGNNKYGFSVYPAEVDLSGPGDDIAVFWSSTEKGGESAYAMEVFTTTEVAIHVESQHSYFSIRCIKRKN